MGIRGQWRAPINLLATTKSEKGQSDLKRKSQPEPVAMGGRAKGEEKKSTLAGGPSRNGAQARDQKKLLFECREAARVSTFSACRSAVQAQRVPS